jgi:hypothetical protein
LRFGFCFDFPAFVVCAGSCVKAERPPQTRHDYAAFCDRPRPRCENRSIVLEFVASSSPYDDAWLTMPDAGEFKEW